MAEIFGWEEWFGSPYKLKIWQVDKAECNEVIRNPDGTWDSITKSNLFYTPSPKNLEREYQHMKREEKLKRITNV